MIISTFSLVYILLCSAALYRGFQIKILRILIKTATATMIMQNFHHSSQSCATTSRSTQQHCNNTMATATTIMQNSHEGHQTRTTDYSNGCNDCAESSHDGKTCATHYGNHHNNYAEFSHEGHQTRATHYGNGCNNCVESSHGKTCATHTTAMATTIMRNSHESHQTCATHYGNSHNNYAEFSHEGHQTCHTTHYSNGHNNCVESSHDGPTKTCTTHTTATAATIMQNFRTVSTQKSQWDKSA